MSEKNVLDLEFTDDLYSVNISVFDKETGSPFAYDADNIASKEYVDDSISEIDIPDVDFTGLATEAWVEEKIKDIGDFVIVTVPTSANELNSFVDNILLPSVRNGIPIFIKETNSYGTHIYPVSATFNNNNGIFTIYLLYLIRDRFNNKESEFIRKRYFRQGAGSITWNQYTTTISIADATQIYTDIDQKIAVNTALIEEIAANVVDIYKVPDKWVSDFTGITYDDCIDFVGEWRKGSYFQHNNDVFTGVNVIVDAESSYIFSYGFLTTKNDKLFVYHVQVLCALPPASETWAVIVSPTYEVYITQSDYDNLNSRITALENKLPVDGEISGDISGVLSQPLELYVAGLIISAENKDTNNATIKMRAANDPVFADVHKIGLYDTGGVDNTSFDGFTFTTSPVVIDDLTYNNTNDWDSLRIRIDNNIYIVGIMLSGDGERSNMWYKKIV